MSESIDDDHILELVHVELEKNGQSLEPDAVQEVLTRVSSEWKRRVERLAAYGQTPGHDVLDRDVRKEVQRKCRQLAADDDGEDADAEDDPLGDWLYERRPSWLAAEVAFEGEGPLAPLALEAMLALWGVSVVDIRRDRAPEALIVGQRKFSQQRIEGLIDARQGKRLRIFSQELLFASVLAAEDPFEGDPKALRRVFGDTHPGLSWLGDEGRTFDWPSAISYYTGGGGALDGDLPTIGVLRYMGYHVGRTQGLAADDRRRILRQAFTSELPYVKDQDHMAEWGGVKTAARLSKLANSLATFCRNRRNQQAPSDHAIRDWEADLGWLKRTFYLPNMRFAWPESWVRS